MTKKFADKFGFDFKVEDDGDEIVDFIMTKKEK